MFGIIMLVMLMIWSCITLVAFGMAPDLADFLRSIPFIIICVGYIIIFAVYFMFKDVFREDDDY